MNNFKNYVTALFVLILFAACTSQPVPELAQVESQPDLAAHSREFKQEVIRVTDGVYVAVGYGLANSILLVGDDGVVIVDTLESAEAAAPVKKAFDDISSKPVKAIIYTHYHPDHTQGARVMAGDDHPEIYSHASTLYYIKRIANITRETTYRRAVRQFGTFLPPGARLNCGIGAELKFNEQSTIALLQPTRTFSGERMALEIAGMKLVLVHAPGETPDQIFIWMPQKKVLLPADNY